MQITSEKIAKTKELYDTLDSKEKVVSDLLIQAKKEHGNNKHKRGDKEVTEVDLWEEIRYNTSDKSAWEILNKAHPQIFEKQKEYEEALKNVQDYVNANLGIDYRKVTVRDIITLVEGIIDTKNDISGEKK